MIEFQDLLPQLAQAPPAPTAPTAEEIVAYFQACIDWGVKAATQYIAGFAFFSLIFILFKR